MLGQKAGQGRYIEFGRGYINFGDYQGGQEGIIFFEITRGESI